jgi:hypothetical protein
MRRSGEGCGRNKHDEIHLKMEESKKGIRN